MLTPKYELGVAESIIKVLRICLVGLNFECIQLFEFGPKQNRKGERRKERILGVFSSCTFKKIVWKLAWDDSMLIPSFKLLSRKPSSPIHAILK